MPSNDITFCASKQCPMRGTCRRAHAPTYLQWPSMSDYYVEGRECVAYWQILVKDTK